MILTKDRTLIILDWDDTLFPTSWITTNEINIKTIKDNNNLMPYFNTIDNELSILLKILSRCGKVIIVTNAMLNWIILSSGILPMTNKLLNLNKEKSNKIEVISAREQYQEKSSNPMSWKTYAFDELLHSAYANKKINNVISVGDAEYEYNALINLYKNKSKDYKLLKSVKFIKYPTRDVLLDQIKVLHQAAVKVCTEKKHLDLKFKVKG